MSLSKDEPVEGSEGRHGFLFLSTAFSGTKKELE
jgi:hypothetical protein